MRDMPFKYYLLIWVISLILLILMNWLFHIYEAVFVPDTLYIEHDEVPVVVTQDSTPVYCSGRVQRMTGKAGQKVYGIEYVVCDSIYENEKIYRSSLAGLSSGKQKYGLLIRNAGPVIDSIAQKYRILSASYNLEDYDLLRIVISSVQYIPYTLVHPGSHFNCTSSTCHTIHSRLSATRFGQRWDFVGGCVENINPFGVFSPVEVAYHHMADCDSRTVFLYCVLKGLGYDIVVLNSDIQSHSVLGVNKNYVRGSAGSAVYMDRLRDVSYLVWETTTDMGPGLYPGFVEKQWYIAMR